MFNVDIKNFLVISEKTEYLKQREKEKDLFFVNIQPRSIKDKKTFMAYLKEKLLFPSYFGHNWDALDECLRDFHWIDNDTIELFHSSFPTLSLKDLNIYIKILHRSILDWQRDGRHKLIVSIDESLMKEVKDISNL